MTERPASNTVTYIVLMTREPAYWESIWTTYFGDSGPYALPLVIHSKHPVHSATARSAALSRSKSVATRWGTSSLVEATLRALEEAILRFPEARLFVLLSGDSVPILPRQILERQLWKLSDSGTVSLLSSDLRELLPEPQLGDIIHSQWCVLSQEAVVMLLGDRAARDKQQESLLRDLQNREKQGELTAYPDECFFGYALSRKALPFRDVAVMWLRWSIPYSAHPDTLSLDEACELVPHVHTSCPCACFMRKVSPSSSLSSSVRFCRLCFSHDSP